MIKGWMVLVSVFYSVSLTSAGFAQDNGGGLVSPQDFQSPQNMDNSGNGLRGPVDQGGNLSGAPIDANPPHAFTPAPYDKHQGGGGYQQGGYQQGGYQQGGYQAPGSNPANNGPGSLDSVGPDGKKHKHKNQSSGGDPGGVVGLTDRAGKSSVDTAKVGVGAGKKAVKEVFKAVF